MEIRLASLLRGAQEAEGTTIIGVNAAAAAHTLYLGSFVIATATVQAILASARRW